MYPEGIVTLVLLVSLLTIAGLCIERSDWSRLVIPISVVAAVSGMFGSVVAKLRILDSLAHLLAMIFGVAVVLGLVAREAAALGPGYRERLRELGRVGFDWYLGQQVPEEMVSYLVSMLMGLIVWLVGYLTSWSLFRRGWVLVALVLPGFLILVNLGYASDPDTRYLAAYALVSLVLLARFSLYDRQREWGRLRLGGPSGLANRFLVIGLVVATLATIVGWRSPASLSQRAFQPLVDEMVTQVQSAQDGATDWMDGLAGTSEGAIPQGGSFTSFDEAFSVGGPLQLSNEPQVLVFADRAPYLTAQHYDSYSGRGWYSTTEDTFNPNGADGRRYAPEMTFGPNQPVPLSDEVTGSRSTSAVEITPLGPSLDRMLTVDTYASSNVSSSVRMSWIQLEDFVFELDAYTIDLLPRDVQRLAVLLLGAELTGASTSGGPAAADPALQADIEAERDHLLARFLDVRWEADEAGSLTSLTVSGQVPVYDDVEAVFHRDTADAGDPYRVVAAASDASESDMRAAGSDYPDWVDQRYLSLPDTITPRTVALTETIVAAADNPYDQARAIEEYLRSNVTYDESVDAPPADADIVDYVLFERQRGYCEYYASAMTVMLRSIGIPARVAVGFYPGDFDQARGGFLYVQKNAHAWTEVFFPGYGWIPFEPTSAQPLIEFGTGRTFAEDETEPTSMAIEETDTAVTPTVAATPDGAAIDSAAQPPQPTDRAVKSGGGWLVPMALGSVVFLVIGAGAWLAWTIPLRGMSPAGALYTRIRRIGMWIGVSPVATATPREFGEAFVERVPQSQRQVHRIVESYELDAYGPERVGPGWLESAEMAWKSLRRHLPAWLIRRGRH
jgi:transglutaminase-like putative cysteine protease